MLVIVLALVLLIGIFGFVMAKEGVNRNMNSGANGEDINDDLNELNNNDKGKDGAEREVEVEREGNKTKFKIMQKIKNESGEFKIKIKGSNIDALSDLNISIGNSSLGEILRVYLSNGSLIDIQIMPDDASGILINKMKVRCARNGCVVKLKENNGNKVVYKLEYEEEYKFFFFFKRKTNATIEIDAHNGSILNVTARKVTICHKPGKINNIITISKNALKAHLAHGDYIGACTNRTIVPPTNNTNVTIPPVNNTNVTTPSINDTNMTNPVVNNTNVTIPEQNNTNVTLINNTDSSQDS